MAVRPERCFSGTHRCYSRREATAPDQDSGRGASLPESAVPVVSRTKGRVARRVARIQGEGMDSSLRFRMGNGGGGSRKEG